MLPRSLPRPSVALAALAGLLVLLVAGATPARAADEPPVLLVGVAGVRWDDVTATGTPALHALAQDARLADVAARSVSSSACPADGWLGVSAGARAADAPPLERTGLAHVTEEDLAAEDERGLVRDRCRVLVDIGPDGLAPGWSDYAAAVVDQAYDARIGLLGDTLREAGVSPAGIGPGAAVALADGAGLQVGTWESRRAPAGGLSEQVSSALAAAPLVVVDAGGVRDREGTAFAPRAEQVALVDSTLAAVLAGAEGTGAQVLVVSLADSGRAELQLAAATGPAGTRWAGPGLLTTGSTQQRGLVQAVDVAPTVLSALGLPADPAMSGSTMRATGGPATAGARIALLEDVAAEADQVREVSGGFSTVLVLLQVALFVAAALVLTRPRDRQHGALRGPVRVLRVVGPFLAAWPVASFLTGLVPWWRAGAPVLGFWAALLGWALVITAVALLGPWRRYVLGPAAVVAAVTVGVLVADALTGSWLTIDSPMGAHRILAARFYGMSNQGFALLLAGGVMLAVVLGDVLVRAGRRRAALAGVVALGLLLVVVDGAPGLGSDFGGPPSLLISFAYLALVVSGRPVRWRVVAAVVAVGAVVVGGFALLDWARPADERTHLGRFVATVLDGGLLPVLQRKLDANLGILTTWRYLVPAVAGIALLWVLARTARRQAAELAREAADLEQAVPLVRAGLVAAGLGLAVGFLVNDSGIIIPATGVALAVPALVGATAELHLPRALRLSPPDRVPWPDAGAPRRAAAPPRPPATAGR
ncbi:hypothetical protein [Cellulomonas marina]|uniref:Phosphoglyceromutase n=1 Tax=Cellulomonas marina TaxID=988821 RepID=A0A1I0XY10_9CELL|nr:hypothetical protein [Cellulomonas marina]GIG28460.1 hypothetical protein Cma02nite_10600 [Cellulomonas marina]SFB05915.1 hypothetical protein SAMN05421867_10659 [Cellulomonas marina]